MAAAIRVREDSLAVHLVCYPRSIINSPVTPRVFPITFNIIVREFTKEEGAIAPGEPPFALLASILVLALVAGTITPSFLTVPVLLVLLPLALIDGAIEVKVLALAIRLIIAPLTDINIAISVDEATDAM